MSDPTRWRRTCQRVRSRIESAIPKHRLPVTVGIGLGLVVVLIAVASGSFGSSEDSRIIFKREGIPDFKNASILGNPSQTILKGEERQFSQGQRALMDAQKELKTEVEKLRSDLQAMTQVTPGPMASPDPSATPLPSVNPIRLGQAAEEFGNTQVNGTTQDTLPTTSAAPTRPAIGFGGERRSRIGRPGAGMISFPVKSTGRDFLREPGVILPSGSYVKAKLLTGVEAPEGRSYPVLMQLDYAYIVTVGEWASASRALLNTFCRFSQAPA